MYTQGIVLLVETIFITSKQPLVAFLLCSLPRHYPMLMCLFLFLPLCTGSNPNKDCPCLEIEFDRFMHPLCYPPDGHFVKLAEIALLNESQMGHVSFHLLLSKQAVFSLQSHNNTVVLVFFGHIASIRKQNIPPAPILLHIIYFLN